MGIASTKKLLNKAYSERAEVIAYLTTLYPSVLAKVSDSEEGFTYGVYIETPSGQLAWHIADADLWNFAGLPIVEDNPWDGESKNQTYYRLWLEAELNRVKGVERLQGALDRQAAN